MNEAEVELLWLLAKGFHVVAEYKQALRIWAGAPWRGFSQEIWEERGQLHWPLGWCLCLALRLYAMRGQHRPGMLPSNRPCLPPTSAQGIWPTPGFY